MEFLVSDLKTHKRITVEEEIKPEVVLGNPPKEVNFRERLHVAAEASLTLSGDVVVKGHIDTKVSLVCGHCLSNFEYPLNEDFEQNFTADCEKIELNNDIRESVLIELPVNPTCKENCAGLCPKCGTNRNQRKCKCNQKSGDPRWKGLDQLNKN